MLAERDAIRAIILTPENEVLLLRIHLPDDKERFWWITPGGGPNSTTFVLGWLQACAQLGRVAVRRFETERIGSPTKRSHKV